MEDFTLVSYSSTVYFDAPRAPAPIEPSSTGTYSIVPSEEPDTIEILFPASYSETKEVINKTTKPIEYSSTYSVDGEVPVTNELTVVYSTAPATKESLPGVSSLLFTPTQLVMVLKYFH